MLPLIIGIVGVFYLEKASLDLRRTDPRIKKISINQVPKLHSCVFEVTATSEESCTFPLWLDGLIPYTYQILVSHAPLFQISRYPTRITHCPSNQRTFRTTCFTERVPHDVRFTGYSANCLSSILQIPSSPSELKRTPRTPS